MKNTTKIFGITLFITAIGLMVMDMYLLTIPEYRSMVKWWHFGLLIIGGIGIYLMPDTLIIDYIKKWLNKLLK